ncbi:hypothetical protein CA13_19140 [Planctomycetes bacterium CA13]|uniref:Uncharacterized protein n=1 Tax=Novipirellula herctigrandis TaxID=2527986 RepID=A0A5C5YZJ1_9BACT|nr:hypothetical protein CA13_19140 [Planctomycetes bacterium CA13]
MDSVQEQTTRLIRPLIPPDAEERVVRAVKQWNGTLRKHIRDSTGLRLNDHDSNQSIPIRVVEGFSSELANLINHYNDPVLWKLIVGQPKIGGLVAGADYLLNFWEEVQNWDKLPRKWQASERSLARSRDLGLVLQKLAIAEKVRKEIRNISEDILGAYFYGSESKIEIYWIAIAMTAAMADVRIEDLTIVVLIHELAHGYTHLGKDIDGGEWPTDGFRHSDAEVKEGLAQFYTHAITESLAMRTPGPRLAYKAFLEMQGGPYLSHLKWLKQHPDRTGEIIRFSMVSARSLGEVKHVEWLKQMRKSGSSLGKKKKQTKELF